MFTGLQPEDVEHFLAMAQMSFDLPRTNVITFEQLFVVAEECHYVNRIVRRMVCEDTVRALMDIKQHMMYRLGEHWHVHYGPWRVNCGPWCVNCGPWRVNCGPLRVNCSPWRVKCGPWRVNCGPWRVNWGPWRVNCGPTACDS
jgi:hypothetical protein